MLLTLTSTSTPNVPSATDLGFLLHKHPDRAQTFELSVGRAHVFYPEASDDRCTAALLVEVDPVDLVRGRRSGGALTDYVNDRPYAASSLLAVAIGRVFRTAMSGTCAVRPDLEGVVMPLEVRVPAVPEPGMVARLFGPLGWSVEVDVPLLDPEVPSWGPAPYGDVRLTGVLTVAEALRHLYVLLPALDGGKHYFVGPDEVDKIVRAAGEWLGGHPERDWILRRTLAHRREYVADAVALLAELDGVVADAGPGTVGVVADVGRPLAAERRDAVLAELLRSGARSVVDVGCGEGALLRALLADPTFTRVVGADVSVAALQRAAVGLDRLPDSVRARLTLLQSSVTYRDDRLAGADAIVLMEVVEHVDLDRLPALEQTVFGAARPRTVVVTTPNAEHNVRYPHLHAGGLRHADHRFEWTRSDLADWASRVGSEYGYTSRTAPVGPVDDEVGPPTQLVVFTARDAA
ncbi:3' terminal RNA ribose 2'-O-methyltransferase Hen1 [Cellulomonas sp. McL0617]|uniref:3' terminal RNA ribose 2'-O-methyltransferase Hen1 n=1 Tax=Cellulomonas sp. McL0617 TaxID=3415675 RepID=UPI003CFADB82